MLRAVPQIVPWAHGHPITKRYSICVTSAHITWTSVPASEQGHKPAEQKFLQSEELFFFLAEDASQLIQGPAEIPDDLATQQ
jgi:hypothetical protein